MIYAHWEGFVKTSCSLYFCHINEKLRRNSIKLSSHFENLREWKIYREGGACNSIKNPIPFLNSHMKLPCADQETLPEDIIDTESNLSSKILRKLVTISDLDYKSFELKEKLIDEKLLAKRNSIAHGDRVKISIDEYDEAETEIRSLLEEFQRLIEAAVDAEAYKAA